MKTPGEKLKDLGRHVTQARLAALLGTTQPNINRILNRGQKPGYELSVNIENMHASFDWPSDLKESAA